MVKRNSAVYFSDCLLEKKKKKAIFVLLFNSLTLRMKGLPKAMQEKISFQKIYRNMIASCVLRLRKLHDGKNQAQGLHSLRQLINEKYKYGN